MLCWEIYYFKPKISISGVREDSENPVATGATGAVVGVAASVVASTILKKRKARIRIKQGFEDFKV